MHSSVSRTAILIPVAPEEPIGVVEKSWECIQKLEKNGLDVDVIYIVDKNKNRDQDEKEEFLKKKEVNVLTRINARGRKAGALNYALENLKCNYDYIAILDVDSRPEPNFLLECIALLKKDARYAIASSPRYITNHRDSLATRIVAVEYRLIADLYRLLNWGNGILLFNGLIGVLDGKIFKTQRLREDVKCEDTEFTERIYLMGRKAALAKKTRVGEQAGITWLELYRQRVRWYTGAYEGLKLYLKPFLKSKLPRMIKFSWLASMTLPFIIVVFIPLLPLYCKRILEISFGARDFLARLIGIFYYILLLQFCGITVIIRKILGVDVAWTAARRSNA
jgi:cellulose synthase/poly-beta-1,6-N-acetylglucosamine synthase-like glycosyltransferase